MADIDRVELLMRLSQNARADNDAWRREIWREGFERAKRMNELFDMFVQEFEAIEAEQKKLAQYLPRQQEKLAEPMPKAVTQGPKP
jgi:hypothetical protein